MYLTKPEYFCEKFILAEPIVKSDIKTLTFSATLATTLGTDGKFTEEKFISKNSEFVTVSLPACIIKKVYDMSNPAILCESVPDL